MALLTSRTLKTEIGEDYLVHVVDPADITDDATGSSFKAVLSESYLPLAGTKSGFPIKGPVEYKNNVDISLFQQNAVSTNVFEFEQSNGMNMWAIDTVTPTDMFGASVTIGGLVWYKDFNKIGEFDTDENFGIGQNTANAEYQIGGSRALSTFGTQNLFVGNSGNATLTGVQNCLVGLRAGEDLTTGTENVFIGQNAGVDVTSGNRNTFYGKQTGFVATTGSDNMATGYRSAFELTTGSQNTMIGRGAGLNVTTASHSVFLGYGSGFSTITQRDFAAAIGYGATVDQDNSLALGSDGTRFRVGINNDVPTAYMDLPMADDYASLRIRKGTEPTSVLNGDIWHEGSKLAWYVNDLLHYQVANIYSQITTVTIANTVTETTILNPGQTLPEDYLTVGKTINIKACGFISTTGTPTIDVRFKLGAVTVANTGALSPNSALSNNYFEINLTLTCRTTGAGGTIFSQGVVKWKDTAGASNNYDAIELVNTATDAIDTTIANVIDLTFQWGTASASNTISITNVEIQTSN